MPARAAIAEATSLALAEGIRRFDAGRFFEAHEVWEDAWREEEGEVRLLLQGLIQVAAGFHKGLVQGRPAGMARLLGTGLRRLEAASGLGLLELEPFRAGVGAWLAAARRWAEGGARPELPVPRLGRAE
jgi:predicted metal-dependent hydrolase